MKYVQSYKARGKLVHYFRRAGKKNRLPDDMDSPEFYAEYAALLKDTEGQKNLGVKRGTFGYLGQSYINSGAFKQLGSSTQTKRQQIIQSMLDEPLNPGDSRTWGEMPLAAVTTPKLYVLRDKKADSPFAADERVKVLNQMFLHGCDMGLTEDNPAASVKRFRKKTNGHHTVTSQEIHRYFERHPVDTMAGRAMSILIYTGLRVSDLAALGPHHMVDGTFLVEIDKLNGKLLHIPVHPVLDELLSSVNTETFVVTEYGKPFSKKGLSFRVSHWFTQAGLPHCSAHSARKGLATILAEQGASEKFMDGLMGWENSKTSAIYTRKAQQAKLAERAVSMIRWD